MSKKNYFCQFHCVLKNTNEKMFHQKLTTNISFNVTVISFPILIDAINDLSNIMFRHNIT